jgi:hypothetical protein
MQLLNEVLPLDPEGAPPSGGPKAKLQRFCNGLCENPGNSGMAEPSQAIEKAISGYSRKTFQVL